MESIKLVDIGFGDRKSTRLNSSHLVISYAVFCLKKKIIDVEHALDPSYAKSLGVNLDDLLVSQPSSGEEALRICETLVRSNALDVIVLDSVAALVTRAELVCFFGIPPAPASTLFPYTTLFR